MSPLKVAGIQGIKIKSGDGVVRRGHPILAACVGGYPEQCLATGTFSGDSPKCDCPNCMLGTLDTANDAETVIASQDDDDCTNKRQA